MSDTNDALQRTESKRRRRELIAVGVASATLVAFVLMQTELPPLSSHTSLLSNLVVILLFDLSFLLLGLMLILVGRNLAKAIFERRRGLIGAKLQARLVFGFVAVAIVPSVFLLYVAGSFLHTGIDNWFDPEYERMLDDSFEIAKVYYLNSANNAAHFARILAGKITNGNLLAPSNHAKLRAFIEQAQQEYNLGTIELFSADRKLLMFQLSPSTPTGIGVSPDSALLRGTLKGHALTRADRFGKSDVIRGTSPIFSAKDSDDVAGAIVVDYYLPKSLAARAAAISQAVQAYFQLRILHQPIMHSYILALVLIGLAVVLLASWFGIYLARELTGPIKLLAEGTHALAAGNLNYEIPPVGDDEIAHLVESFNRMTSDLRKSQTELESRRRYTETLLLNVSAGVVGLDPAGRISSINPCAERMLGIRAAEVLGREYSKSFGAQLRRSLDEIFAGAVRPREARRALKLEIAGTETELMVTASRLDEDDANEDRPNLGTVLFFEDVSQIAKVERMEAWREVARRIAHEIKNPLTPIQLSAERLRRQFFRRETAKQAPQSEVGFAPHDSDDKRFNAYELVDECTRTIIGEVDDLKRLVDEFAAFARMPQVSPVPGNLNTLVEETVATFREAHSNVHFELQLDPALPIVAIDREALKRALVNLLDNAVAATAVHSQNGIGRQISVRTALDPINGMVMLEVVDNGIGIDPRIRPRIFEPYFSTRKDGTGLGLAIVATIVTDHNGFVRVRDNEPRGSRFQLEFPIKDQEFRNVS
ncbi:MAG TPA: ATP-binding protein [Candidatus Binataceae bacterium]|nr:ATP-binding protein [Candidatus Binataceae bacterium]